MADKTVFSKDLLHRVTGCVPSLWHWLPTQHSSHRSSSWQRSAFCLGLNHSPVWPGPSKNSDPREYGSSSIPWRVVNSEVDTWLSGLVRLGFGTHGMLGQWCSRWLLGCELKAPGCYPVPTADKPVLWAAGRRGGRSAFLLILRYRAQHKERPFLITKSFTAKS